MRLFLLFCMTISACVILPGCSREKGEIDYVPDFTQMVQSGEIEQLNIVEDSEGNVVISGQRKSGTADSKEPLQFKLHINEFDADLEEFLTAHDVEFTFTSQKESRASK
jgi:hypothetical protein